ncbi:MAG: PQQ-binding-like beta-propeller repeat protein [Planctomycetota bacterium]|nr:PQQ-binding-like beta-propeller repeat protein [Planctomycetota bacterium]
MAAAFLSQVASVRAGEPPAPEAKPKGPEHNVTLAEEPAVLELLAKAQKARARAEKDPEVWPECVKYYGEILRKYPNTVYLDRWEGPDKTDLAYKNGLYKSTRERVAQDIASLPPAGLAIYRVVSDPPARTLFQEAQNEFDVRKMEQVAQVYFPTSWGDDALAWLAETAHDRGAPREVVVRVGQALKHPSLSVSKIGLLIRTLLAQVELGNQAAAEQTLQEITALAPTAKDDELRAGHATGPAALEKLKARVASAQQGPAVQPVAAASRSWPTYFGNAAHNRVAAARRNVGLRKWSVPIVKLLYGPNADAPTTSKVMTSEGTAIPDPTINYHLSVQEGYFYLCNNQLVVSYPVGNPQPGPPAAGNAKFFFPSDVQPPAKTTARDSMQMRRFGRNAASSLRHHPYFCTLAEDRLFLVLGAEAPTVDPDMIMWGGRQEQPKTPSNYIVALGRQGPTGTLESGKLVWSLQADGHAQAFESQSKADQEWLKSVLFVSAPTYEAGVLYALAVHTGSMHEAWVAAFDADNGRLIWRTSVCSANPMLVGGVVQPDLGLPVAVSGGTVFAVTNLGAVAALDTMSGSIKWIRIYDRMAVNVDRFNRGMRTASDFWGPNPPIVWENVVYVTPQDSELLYAYDIETGRRVWHISRTERDPGLKHVLGISNSNLVVTGANVHFYELKGGRETGPAEPFSFDSSIKGRGIVTDNVVLVPTEKSLVSIETSLVDGKFRPRLLSEHNWSEPEREAGNAFVAGDVLYTISNSHVNAYFVWEEMEARLKERIARDPNDLGAYGEVADVYHRVGRYDQALSILDKALQVAATLDFTEKQCFSGGGAGARPGRGAARHGAAGHGREPSGSRQRRAGRGALPGDHHAARRRHLRVRAGVLRQGAAVRAPAHRGAEEEGPGLLREDRSGSAGRAGAGRHRLPEAGGDTGPVPQRGGLRHGTAEAGPVDAREEPRPGAAVCAALPEPVPAVARGIRGDGATGLGL